MPHNAYAQEGQTKVAQVTINLTFPNSRAQRANRFWQA